MIRTVEDFAYAYNAEAIRRVYDVDGAFAPRGSIGWVCDLLPHETSEGGYVVVDFPETGPMLCYPTEVRPSRV